MKFKRVIAVVLCIGLIVTSFNGIITSYAKIETKNNEESSEYFTRIAHENMNITMIEPELIEQEISPSSSYIGNANDEQVIYESTRVNSQDENQTDVYNISGEDIELFMKNGFTIQEIFEVDKLANEIIEDPKNILDRKLSTNKSLEEIKNDILKERKIKNDEYLKDKYQKEIKKLNSKNISEKEIITLLEYIEVNKIEMSDELIKQYSIKSESLFKEKNTFLSEESKNNR
jgi:hypothetical protein